MIIPATVNLTLYRGTTFGPILIIAKDGDDNVVPLVGWTAHAQVRQTPQKPAILDLVPTITDEAGGETTIPGLTDEETKAIPVQGEFIWDFLLERPSGEILGPFLSGAFSIKTATTRT